MEERPRPGGDERDSEQQSIEARKRRLHHAMRSLQGHAEEEKTWHELTSDDEEEKEAAENRTKHNRREVALDALAHRERRGVPSGTLHGLFDRSLNNEKEDEEKNTEGAHQILPQLPVEGNIDDSESLDDAAELRKQQEEALELPPVDPLATELNQLERIDDDELVSGTASTASTQRHSPYRPMFTAPPLHTRNAAHDNGGGSGAGGRGHGGGSGGTGGGTTGGGGHGGTGGGGGHHGGGGHGGGPMMPPIINVVHGPNHYNTIHNHNITNNHNIRRRAIAGLLLVDLVDYVAARRREGKIKRKNEADHKEIRASIAAQEQAHQAALEANKKQQQETDEQLKRLRRQAEERNEVIAQQPISRPEQAIVTQVAVEKTIANDAAQSVLERVPDTEVMQTHQEMSLANPAIEQIVAQRKEVKTNSPDRLLEQQIAVESLYEKLHESRGGGSQAVGGASAGGPALSFIPQGNSTVINSSTSDHRPQAMQQYRPKSEQATSPMLWIAMIVIIIFLFAVIIFAR